MRVRVVHLAIGDDGFGPNGEIDICIDIEMPLLPAIGMEIKPTRDSDYLRISHVFWDIGASDIVEAHIDRRGMVRRLSLMETLGWRRCQ